VAVAVVVLGVVPPEVDAGVAVVPALVAPPAAVAPGAASGSIT
jgi:hypothetical protein